MTRLDEKGIKGTLSDPFIEVDTVIDLQANVYSTIKKFYLIKQHKINDVSFYFGAISSMVRNLPQMYDIAAAAFGQNSTFHQWVQSLSADNQKDFELSLRWLDKGDSEVQVGRTVFEFEGRSTYQNSNYVEKTKSKWLQHQENNATLSKSKRKVAFAVEEFIRNERIAVINSCTTQVILFEYLHDPSVSNTEKESINRYLAQLALYREAYEALNLYEVLNPEDQSIEETVVNLCQKYNSRSYEKYQGIMESLFPLGMPLNDVSQKYPHLQPVFAYMASLFQRPPRYDMPFLEMADNMAKAEMDTTLVDQALRTAKIRSASFQGVVDAYHAFSHLPMGSSQRKEASLLGLLQLHALKLNYSDEAYQSDQNKAHYSTYLENLLVEAYPECFMKPDDLFLISKEISRNSIEIYDALSIDIYQSKKPLNPSAFKSNELDELYRVTDKPVWIILKMLKPVDEQFSILKKIEAYQGLIQLTRDGRFRFNHQPALEQARFLANELLNIVEQRVKDHPEELSTELRASMETINRSIESSTTAKAYKKAIQTLTGEDRAAMPLEDKTVQRKYREFLAKTDVADGGAVSALR